MWLWRNIAHMPYFDSYYTRPELRRLRQELRNQATPAERKLWFFLRGRNLLGFKFRRQHSIGRYILDFYCLALRLEIELDGGHHYAPEQMMKDEARSTWLKHFCLKIIRVSNNEVMNNIDGVVEYLGESVTKRAEEMRHPNASHHPSAPAEGNGTVSIDYYY